MKNAKAIGKYIIVKDLKFSDFHKNIKGKIKVYDTEREALLTCGMYEFEDVLVLQVMHNHVEKNLRTKNK